MVVVSVTEMTHPSDWPVLTRDEARARGDARETAAAVMYLELRFRADWIQHGEVYDVVIDDAPVRAYYMRYGGRHGSVYNRQFITTYDDDEHGGHHWFEVTTPAELRYQDERLRCHVVITGAPAAWPATRDWEPWYG